jgi:NAD(P)-dependent dehydrogenase (short-subunit alcohol dehydrogenase family)
MNFSIDGRVALVTGGATGIGLASAVALSREGVRVILSGRRAEVGAAALAEIREAGGEVIFIQSDVSKSSAVESLVARAASQWGKLDFLVNNAGIEGPGFIPCAEYSEEDWDDVMAINLKGTWLCMKHAIPYLLKQPGGAIVNISSVGGVNGGSLGVAYHASKHGVLGVTRAAAIEYGGRGLRVNAVAPGAFPTAMTQRLFPGDAKHDAIAASNPMKRWGRLEEVAGAVVWLCSPAAGYVNGHTLAVDGGFLIQ